MTQMTQIGRTVQAGKGSNPDAVRSHSERAVTLIGKVARIRGAGP